ncbi:MAG TPA: ABC transporter permease [Gammaproteobacteria bacterium]|nr:ABC transporter permease [Gammaproteobacteria bacterium]
MIGNMLLMALREVRRHAMRSALTMLGIIIGVAAVITMVTLGGGATARVTGEIASLGRNMLVLVPGASRHGPAMTSAPPLEMADVAAIQREIPGLAAVAPAASRPTLAVYANHNWPTTVTGTDDAYLRVREWPLSSGREFDSAELRAGRMVCLLGATVKKELFGAQDPLGAIIRLGKIPCRVIGVLEAKGQSSFGTDQDDLLLVPIRAFHRRIAGNRDVGVIFLSSRYSADTPDIQRRVTQLMRERRHVPEAAEDDFTVRDMKEIVSVLETASGVLTTLLGAIAAVSLVVGGIGIMNIMLVSVTERTREIGIRLAVGAREREVLLQFLVEAVLLSLLGGLAGIGLGLGCSLAAARLVHVPFIPDVPIIGIAFGFAGLIGVVFGYFPARKAARLDPIEALRHE